jgi:hypothetical protein
VLDFVCSSKANKNLPPKQTNTPFVKPRPGMLFVAMRKNSKKGKQATVSLTYWGLGLIMDRRFAEKVLFQGTAVTCGIQI